MASPTLNGADINSVTTAVASSIVFRRAIATKSDLRADFHILVLRSDPTEHGNHALPVYFVCACVCVLANRAQRDDAPSTKTRERH